MPYLNGRFIAHREKQAIWITAALWVCFCASVISSPLLVFAFIAPYIGDHEPATDLASAVIGLYGITAVLGLAEWLRPPPPS